MSSKDSRFPSSDACRSWLFRLSTSRLPVFVLFLLLFFTSLAGAFLDDLAMSLLLCAAKVVGVEVGRGLLSRSTATDNEPAQISSSALRSRCVLMKLVGENEVVEAMGVVWCADSGISLHQVIVLRPMRRSAAFYPPPPPPRLRIEQDLHRDALLT